MLRILPFLRGRLVPLLAMACVVSLGPSIPAYAEPEGEEADTAHRSGVEAVRSRDYVAAVTAFERAARLRPDRVDTWLELGMAQSRLRHWDEAIDANARALELEPDNVKGHHNLGNIHFRKGDFDAAVGSYARTLELDPDHILAAFHLGWTLRQLHRTAEAEQAFNRCLEIPARDTPREGTRIDCIFGLGSLRHRAGNYKASALMMKEVLDFHPGHPEARYYLAMVYRQLGRLEEARHQLEIHSKILNARREAMDAAGQRGP